MKNKKNLDCDSRGKRIACTVALFVLFFSLNTASASQNVLTDQQKNQIPALNSDESTKQIPVSGDDVAVSDQSASSQGTQQVSSSDTAKALAYGYAKAGKDKKTIIGNLQNMGYSPLESQLAYTSAVNQLSAEKNTAENTASVTTQTEQTAAQQTTQTTTEDSTKTTQEPALKYLETKTGVVVAPLAKFKSKKQLISDAASTAKDMLGKGYSTDEIAAALKKMDYSTTQTAQIFKQAGVSASDAYSAISKVELKQMDSYYSNTKKGPTAKFRTLFTAKYNSKADAEQHAITGVMKSMQSAGYDTSSFLDGAVSDLKATGMSAGQIFNQAIKDVAEAKPAAAPASSPQLSTYGQGEVNLAKAMLKSGFSETEVSNAFQNQNNTTSGAYSYTKTTTDAIISAANKLLNQTGTGTV